MIRFILSAALLVLAQSAYAQVPSLAVKAGQSFVDKTGVEQIQGPGDFSKNVTNRSMKRPILVIIWDESPRLVPHLKMFEKVVAEFGDRLGHVYLKLPISSMKADGSLRASGNKADVLSKAFRLGVVYGAGGDGYPLVVAYYHGYPIAHTIIAINLDDAHIRAAMRAFCNQVVRKTQ